MSLLTATGSYDLSAIMRKAQALASHHARRDPHVSRAAHLSRWLKDVWAEARRATDRHIARNGGNGTFRIFFDTMQASFAPGAPSPAGMVLRPALATAE